MAPPPRRKLHDKRGVVGSPGFEGCRSCTQTLLPQTLHRECIALFGQEASFNIHAIPLARGIGDVSVLLVFSRHTAERRRAELSLSHLGSAPKEADNQHVVIDQFDRETRLIQQLLDYVRPTPAAMQDIDLAHSLHAVGKLLAPGSEAVRYVASRHDRVNESPRRP